MLDKDPGMYCISNSVIWYRIYKFTNIIYEYLCEQTNMQDHTPKK